MTSANVGAACLLLLGLAASVVLPGPSARADEVVPPSGYAAAAASQGTANAGRGPRSSPAKVLPVPAEDVSPQLRAAIAAPYLSFFDGDPKSPEEWRAFVAARTRPVLEALPALRERMGVTVEPGMMGGVRVHVVTPRTLPPGNRNRVLVHVHGGGYVFGPGEAGTPEAILMAGFGGFRVISVDYRMPPDAPFPAALDDAMAVWKEVVGTTPAGNAAIFGTSTGGALTLAMALRARDEKLPLPAAIAPGTPWSDIGKVGDSYAANEWLDNVLVTWDGWLGRAARLYAAGTDLKHPYVSPIYGDFSGLPPAILTSGTRDLFLSNTVRTHRKLRRAGVEAELNVYEGMSHAQYQDPAMPESREVFADIARFFDRHLGR